MKPGTKVALVTPESTSALLGTLVQPLIYGDERRWTVAWGDGFLDSAWQTWPEKFLFPVVPQ